MLYYNDYSYDIYYYNYKLEVIYYNKTYNYKPN